MKCSDCEKGNVCMYKVAIFKSFAGIINRFFGPVSPKMDKVNEFIWEMCEKRGDDV